MIEVAIMIEGQNGLNWTSWQRIAQAVEDLGFVGLYRSDHYTNANPPDRDSLELWVSLTWLASHTQRIEFGPLVSPVSFRHPTMTSRMAAAVDNLSNGRLTLGLGAGWQEREHRNYGWELLDVASRFDRFDEGVEIIYKLIRSAEPVDFNGDYYRLREAVLLPRPRRSAELPILIGGNGPKRTMAITARFADWWNGIFLPPNQFAELNARLDEHLETTGRSPGMVRRSLMTGCVFGLNQSLVEEAVEARTKGNRNPEELRQRGLVVGTPSEIVDQLGHFAEAGVQRIMLQWLDLDDLDGLEALAKHILPQVHI